MINEERDLLIAAVERSKTDYIRPHEYIIQKKSPELFAALADALENDKEVYSATFKGCEYHYLVIGAYKYWRIENVLNRARVLSR